jgi:hypothetical protein
MARARSLPTTSRCRRRIWGFDASHRNPSTSSLRTQGPNPPKLAAMESWPQLVYDRHWRLWVSGSRLLWTTLRVARSSLVRDDLELFRVSDSNFKQHHHSLLCEPTGRANARPMTGSAKQSTEPCNERMLASSLARFAMTQQDTLPRSRGMTCPSLALILHPTEGAGNAGRINAPAASRAK